MLASALTEAAGAIGEPLREALGGLDPGEPVDVIVYFAAQADRSGLQALSPGERRVALPELLKKHAANSQSPIKTYLHSQGVTRFKTLWINNALAVTVPVRMVATLAARPEVERVDLDATVNLPSPVNNYR